MPTPRTSWYVVHSKLRQERRAAEHLERQGYSCYLPTLHVERIQQGRKLDCVEALFPRYLFIQLDDVETNWHPIRSTRGVDQLVCCNSQPLPVKDGIVEQIRARMIQGEGRVPYLRGGEHVRITEGPFARVDAIFVANDGDERVVLLMNLLHKEQAVSFPSRSVRRID